MEDRGIELPLKSSGKTWVSDQSGAECGAVVARKADSDPGLAAVVEAWPKLPEAIRADILAMIRAAEPPRG